MKPNLEPALNEHIGTFTVSAELVGRMATGACTNKPELLGHAARNDQFTVQEVVQGEGVPLHFRGSYSRVDGDGVIPYYTRYNAVAVPTRQSKAVTYLRRVFHFEEHVKLAIFGTRNEGKG